MAQKKSTSNTAENTPVQFVFGRSNYTFMLISIAVIALGFILMMGDKDIYDFRKIVLAPIVVLLGFGIAFYAILKKRS